MPSSQERHHNRRLAKMKKKITNHQLCLKIIFLRRRNEEGWKTQGHGETSLRGGAEILAFMRLSQDQSNVRVLCASMALPP